MYPFNDVQRWPGFWATEVADSKNGLSPQVEVGLMMLVLLILPHLGENLYHILSVQRLQQQMHGMNSSAPAMRSLCELAP